MSTNVGRLTGVKFDGPASDSLEGTAEAAIVVGGSSLLYTNVMKFINGSVHAPEFGS